MNSRSNLLTRLDALLSTPSPTESQRSSFENTEDMRRPILRSSPDFSLLREALHEPLITRPPIARLPPSFTPKRLTRPPPFLDNLTRSTLPTASLSPPLLVTSSNDATITPPPIILSHSPPQRTSLDTLRRMSRHSSTSAILASAETESIASTASSFLPNLPNLPNFSTSWWFSEPNSPEPSTSSLLSEDDQNQSLKKKYKSTANPVVFCHGLLGFDSLTLGPAIAPFQVIHWRGIKEVLEQNGTEVLITRVPATSSYVDRAKVLEERISSIYPGQSVHLIGHSMGGLDCRYLTTHLTQRKFKVLSITTIATPHRGSSFADHFLKTVGPERMPSVMSLLDLLPNGGGDGKAFECLTLDNMKNFNEETPDVEGVKYFSWGAVYQPGLIDTWKWPHSVILDKEGPNDGLVSVESSKWGTYLGTLQQVNHLDLVGWTNTARYKWAEIMGKEIKFRPATFYLGIVDMLGRKVEGQKDEDEDEDEDESGTVNEEREQEEGESNLEQGQGQGQDVEESQTKTKSNSKKPETEEGTETGERQQMMNSLEDAGAHTHTDDSGSPGPTKEVGTQIPLTPGTTSTTTTTTSSSSKTPTPTSTPNPALNSNSTPTTTSTKATKSRTNSKLDLTE